MPHVSLKPRRRAGKFILCPAVLILLPAALLFRPTESAHGRASAPVSLTGAAARAYRLFTANANGQGVAAALALRVKADGTQSFEPVAQFDAGQNRFVAVGVDLGPNGDQVFLALYGTGIRLRSALSGVSATIGGLGSEVLFADAAPGFVGLDQVNVRLSRALAGRGEVDVLLSVDGRAANPVRVSIR